MAGRAVCAARARTAAGLFDRRRIAFNVSRQTREIGIRMALGAGRRRVIRQVIVESLPLVGAGGVVGALAAGFAGRILASALYGVSPVDALTWTIALGTLIVAAVVPARRAATVDPISALKQP